MTGLQVTATLKLLKDLLADPTFFDPDIAEAFKVVGLDDTDQVQHFPLCVS